MSANAFQISSSDNVAVVLDDTGPGIVKLLGAGQGTLLSVYEPVRLGHKIALTAIAPGDPIMKFGVRIGHATARIAPGAWVHLHNCSSDYDERSNSLEVTTGVPQNTIYQ